MAKKTVDTIEVNAINKGMKVEETLTPEMKVIRITDSVGKIATLISHDLVNGLVEVTEKAEKVFYGTYAEFKKGWKTSKLASSLLIAGIIIKFSAVLIETALGFVGLDVDLNMVHRIADTAIGAGAGILFAEAGLKTFKGVRAGLSMSDAKLADIKKDIKPWDIPFLGDMLTSDDTEESAI